MHLTINIQHNPEWQRGGLAFWENGGREPDHCLDMTLCLNKWIFNLFIWRLGVLGYVLRYVPTRRTKPYYGRYGWKSDGFVIGRLPLGRRDDA
jgi:hypothetical protein